MSNSRKRETSMHRYIQHIKFENDFNIKNEILEQTFIDQHVISVCDMRYHSLNGLVKYDMQNTSRHSLNSESKRSIKSQQSQHRHNRRRRTSHRSSLKNETIEMNTCHETTMDENDEHEKMEKKRQIRRRKYESTR
jgi:hypothetical protein